MPNLKDNKFVLFTSVILLTFFEGVFNDNESIEIANLRAYFQSMKNYMNRTVDPCDDFYEYACGNWPKYHPLPNDKTQIDLFSILQDKVDILLRDLLENAVRTSRNDEAVYKAAKFYESCIDEESILLDNQKTFIKFIEDNGCWPALYPDLQEEEFDWLTTVAKSSSYGVDALIRVSVSEDFEDSTSYKIYIIEPDVGMFRDNFLLESKSHILTGYKNMISQILQLLDVDESNSTAAAEEIVQFEIEIAKIIADPNEAFSIDELSHVMSIDKLQSKYNFIDWQNFLYLATGRIIDKQTKINLYEKNYFTPFFKLINRTKTRTIMNYVMWRITQTFVNTLDERFKAVAEIFNEIVVGKTKQQPRWKICVEDTRDKLGLAVSALYIRNYFNESTKYIIMRLVEQLKNIFIDIIRSIAWMNWRTANYAVAKLEAMKIEVGYPKILKSEAKLNERYNDWNISENYFENTINLNQLEFERKVNILNEKVDRNDWDQYPIVINAANDIVKNRILVNAAILQLPFYSIFFPKSILYGGLGSVLGHELTHGFDRTGSLFDFEGNRKNWWSNSSAEAFHDRANCFIEQYSNYTYQGHQINGIVSNSENIADNGGIRESYYAFIRGLVRPNKLSENVLQQELEELLNLTEKQIFFLQFAQLWCQTFKPEAIEDFLESDIHAPGKIRVIGVLSNFEEFSTAFDCPLGSKMNPVDKCTLW